MRSARLIGFAFVAAVAAAAAVAACGSSGGSNKKNPDAGKTFMDAPAKVFMDAPPPNVLGQLCPFASGGSGSACPAQDECVMITGVGSTKTGYCTQDCMGSDALCSTGYTGPSGGMPVCALQAGSGSGSQANGCAIICTTAAQCPTGMSCLQVQAGPPPISACVPSP